MKVMIQIKQHVFTLTVYAMFKYYEYVKVSVLHILPILNRISWNVPTSCKEISYKEKETFVGDWNMSLGTKML